MLSLQIADTSTSPREPQAPAGRELSAATCQELLEAAAVAIALAATSAADSGGGGSIAPPPQAADAESPFVRPPPPLPPPESTDDDAVALTIGAGGIIEGGALPDLGFGPEVEIAAVYRHLRLALAGTWLSPRDAPLSQGFVMSIGLISVDVLACGQLDFQRRVYLFGCAAWQMGRLHAELERDPSLDLVTGSLDREPAATTWLAPGARIGASFVVEGPFELISYSALYFPLTRPEFFAGVGEQVHTPTPYALRFFVGALFRL
ncbi:MAG: hypothetical protein ABW321_27345 [Polyangiales bacterium]